MPDQGPGCMLDNTTKRAGRDPSLGNLRHNKAAPWARGSCPPTPAIGGQCTSQNVALPPHCPGSPAFAACKAAPGVGGICYKMQLTHPKEQKLKHELKLALQLELRRPLSPLTVLCSA